MSTCNLTIPAKMLAICLSVMLGSCSLTRLDPDQIAARITIRPTWLELAPAPMLGGLQGLAQFRAGLQACNGNDMDLKLIEAPWTAQLAGVHVGAGTVEGPVSLQASACQEVIVEGTLSLASAGSAVVEAMLGGHPLVPVVDLDAVVQVYGVQAHRKLRLGGFALRSGQ